ncbi:MAG: NAD-dependent epimerase/dehydratase family protein, partial [Terriglobales bacterium]
MAAPFRNMSHANPTMVVTGVSGNLGCRLLSQLSAFRVVGVDLNPPAADTAAPALQRFVRMDLGEEASCRQMVAVLRESGPAAVVHLAFVIDPVRTGVLDVDRMWRINLAGTARVMEAITEYNRYGGSVRKFLY